MKAALLLVAAARLACGTALAGDPAPAEASPAAQSLPVSAAAPAPASASAAGGTDTASVQDLPLLPARPSRKIAQKNVAWEDFTVVTLISLPFTALWCGLAAVAVSLCSGNRLPLSSTSPLVEGAGCLAGAASVTIGLVSVSWGGSAAPQGASATARP
jgi:hypothetical protein